MQKATDNEVKRCSVCKEEKPLGEFYQRRTRRRGYQSECRTCCRIRRAKWWKSTNGKVSAANSKLKARFGITLQEFNALLEKQNHKCLICGGSVSYLGHKLAVDHDHATGNIRGLLCKACNLGIGNFNDDPDLLKKARDYLLGLGGMRSWEKGKGVAAK